MSVQNISTVKTSIKPIINENRLAYFGKEKKGSDVKRPWLSPSKRCITSGFNQINLVLFAPFEFTEITAMHQLTVCRCQLCYHTQSQKAFDFCPIITLAIKTFTTTQLIQFLLKMKQLGSSE